MHRSSRAFQRSVSSARLIPLRSSPLRCAPLVLRKSNLNFIPRTNLPLQRRLFGLRFYSSLTSPASEQSQVQDRPPVPSYQLTFTCKPCGHRSSHTMSKQGYHHGTVLITCPSCKNRHVISDHLKIFMDESSTLEDILQRRAGPGGDLSKLLKKGRLGQRQGQMVANEGEEDIEFWDDGTETKHATPT